MGGLVPLGYEVRDRQLVINEAEAATVRHIFTRYCELGSVRLLKEELRPKWRPLEDPRLQSWSRVGWSGVLTRGALYVAEKPNLCG